MVETQSRIYANMDPEALGLAPDVQVQLLPPAEFVQRYVDVVALGDTVLRYPGLIAPNIRRLSVHPWELDDRQRVYERHLAHGLTFASTPEPPKGPIPREEAERRVNNLLLKQRITELNQRNDPIAIAKKFLRFWRGDESDYMLTMEPYEYLPDVIILRGIDRTTHEVVINREADRQYKPSKF